MPDVAPPVSAEPQAKPPRRTGYRLIMLLFGVLAANAALAAVYFATRPAQNPAPPITIGDDFGIDPDAERNRMADKALERMNEIAGALVTYRERFGDGMRWPADLSELGQMGLLPRDFEFTGVLSARMLVYQPDVPPGCQPDGWVMVCDRLEQMRLVPGRRGRSRVVVGAAVILGDGTARYLDEREVGQFSGMSTTGEIGEPVERLR